MAVEPRLDYLEQKQERMRGYERELDRLRRTAEEQSSPEAASHIQELKVSSDRLRVAYGQLQRIERTNDEQWADAKRNFERFETELEQSLRESAARIESE